MKLSRCTLKKHGKKVILQGLIHGIPKAFFDWLKDDIRVQTRNGYRIFYEGIRKYEDDEQNFSEKEIMVLKCFQFIEDIKEELINGLDLNPQYDNDNKTGINYPKNAVNIDISWVKFIKLLAKNIDSKDCQDFLDTLESIPREKLIKDTTKTMEKLLNGDVTLKQMEVLSKSINFVKMSDSIEIEYRNFFASEKIDEFSNKNNKIYVQYGESHIDGIIDILVNRYGWRLVKKRKLNLDYDMKYV